MRSKFLLIFALAAIVTSSAFGQTTAKNGTSGVLESVAGADKGYLIGPGDVVSITVLGEKTFDVTAATVDEDGMLVIPYTEQPIIAKCKTERQLQGDVVTAYSRYLRRPQLNVRVVERNSRPPVSVYGAVVSQQRLELKRRAYLMELVAYAGVDKDKSSGSVQLFRAPQVCPGMGVELAEGETAVPFSVYSLTDLQKGMAEANPEVFAGDVVFLPKADPVYVVGQVVKPGEIGIPAGGLTLTQAVAMAAGPAPEAKKKTIKVYRKKPGTTTPEVLEYRLDEIKKGEAPDPALQAYDIVELGKAKKDIGDLLYDVITGMPAKVPLPIRPF